ncbi:MAG: hypothetical protein Q8P41_11370 [Pseudomonadota bacterium]|nr:hypothetical protein [Pseudomonadota bacterium]
MSGQTSWLMDGVITHVQLVPGPEGATLPVTGEDVSYYMDLVALSVPFPALPDVAIVLAALAGYAFIGIIPDLDPTIGSYVPDPLVEVRQNETHRALVQRLAERNGALFFVEPTGPGTNRAYWGASPRVGVPQPVLSINLGPETNVRSLSFAADLSSPTFVDRVVQGNFGEDIEVTGSGELDVWRYQAVLRPRRLVNVRGAGSTFDGLWYVKSVKHTIRAASYLQAFQLERGGLGTTISSV